MRYLKKKHRMSFRTFIEFFVSIVPNLKISIEGTFEIIVNEINEPVLESINKFKHHASINTMKSKKNYSLKFNKFFLSKTFHQV